MCGRTAVDLLEQTAVALTQANDLVAVLNRLALGQIIYRQHGQRVKCLVPAERTQKEPGLDIMKKGADFGLRQRLLDQFDDTSEVGAVHKYFSDIL